nr:protein phosphatase 2C domain-containing protein [Acutalibacter muris]
MRVDFVTDSGTVRSTNQDACRCGTFSPGSAWAVVCDGMGGAKGGNVASAIAVEQIEEQLKKKFSEKMSQGNTKSMIINAVHQANTAIYDKAKEKPELHGMGTTAVVLLASQGRLHVAHVGDSRAYLKNSGGLTQITMDHSYVLGVHDMVSVDYSVWDFHAGDQALACTDGLTGYMEDSLLEEYMERYSHEGEALAGQLLQYAINSGGADNITIAVVNNT